jgi:hypothetical protein
MFADWDNDGYPDHVMGPDGLWRSFDPHTGEMAESRQAPQAPAAPPLPPRPPRPRRSRQGRRPPHRYRCRVPLPPGERVPLVLSPPVLGAAPDSHTCHPLAHPLRGAPVPHPRHLRPHPPHPLWEYRADLHRTIGRIRPLIRRTRRSDPDPRMSSVARDPAHPIHPGNREDRPRHNPVRPARGCCAPSPARPTPTAIPPIT